MLKVQQTLLSFLDTLTLEQKIKVLCTFVRTWLAKHLFIDTYLSSIDSHFSTHTVNQHSMHQLCFTLDFLTQYSASPTLGDYAALHTRLVNIPFSEVRLVKFSGGAFDSYLSVSEQEQSLQDTLTSLGLAYETQVQIGIFNVDFLLKDKVILEMMGHQHFSYSNTRHAFSLGRQKYLENKGYSFLFIKTASWRYVSEEKESRESFLRQVLHPVKRSVDI